MKPAIRRLTTLANFLDALKDIIEPHFEMRNSYVQTNGKSLYSLNDNPDMRDLLHCGTQACAAGYAMTIPEFQSAGLGCSAGRPKYNGYFAGRALEKFFRLSETQQIHLFGGDKQRTVKQEVAVLRAFIRRHA